MSREEAFCGIRVHPPTHPLIHFIPSHPSMCSVCSSVPSAPSLAFVFRRARRRLRHSSAFRLFVVVTRVGLAGGSFTTRYALTYSSLSHESFSTLITTFTTISHSSPPCHFSLRSSVLLEAVANSKRNARPWTTDALSLACKQTTQRRSDGRTEGRKEGRNQMCGGIEKLGGGRKE